MLGRVSASMIFNFGIGKRMSRCILSCRYVAEKDCLALLQAPPVRLNADGNCAFSETRRAAKLLQQFGGFPFPAADWRSSPPDSLRDRTSLCSLLRWRTRPL